MRNNAERMKLNNVRLLKGGLAQSSKLATSLTAMNLANHNGIKQLKKGNILK